MRVYVRVRVCGNRTSNNISLRFGYATATHSVLENRRLLKNGAVYLIVSLDQGLACLDNLKACHKPVDANEYFILNPPFYQRCQTFNQSAAEIIDVVGVFRTVLGRQPFVMPRDIEVTAIVACQFRREDVA